MNHHAYWVMLVALGTSGLAARGQAPTPTPEPAAKVDTAYDLVYTRVGDQEMKLDLARPGDGEGPFPAVVVIHGGAWRAGDKASNRQVLERLARRGYVAISPQYRFCPKEIFPAQVHDVKAAVRWLKAHADDYRVDPDHVGAMGFSAGGHLALMLGVTGPDDGLEGDVPAVGDGGGPDSRVRAVVNYFGPTDLLAPDLPDVSKPLVRDFLGGAPRDKEELAKRASPITFVTKDDPPVLTFQGTKDPLVPHTQATKLADALTAAGVRGRVELIVGGGHGDWGRAEIERTLDDSIAFLDGQLKPER
jgi:acetyl esterase/lipase